MIRIMKRLLLSICLPVVAAATLAAAPFRYHFNHFLTQDGLAGNSVYCTAQDRYGFIWIGTGDGICWYDGYRFYYMTGLMEGKATALCTDDGGLIWFSTSSGNGYYDPATGRTVNIGIAERAPASAIVSGAHGDIWFLFQDLYRYDKASGKVTVYPEAEFFRAGSLTADSYGTIWCTSAREGELFRYDDNADRFFKEGAVSLRSVQGISDGRLLTVDRQGNVFATNPMDGTQLRIFSCRESGCRTVLCTLERRPGEYWISTDNGIWIIAEEGMRHILYSEKDRLSISSSRIRNLFADADGNVWAGSYYRGINLWHDSRDAYDLYYQMEGPESMKGRIVQGIRPDASGAIWMGTEEGGLNRFDPATKSFTGFTLSGSSTRILDILPEDDILWVATYSGLYRCDKASGQVLEQVNLPDNRISCLFQMDSGTILAGAEDGLYGLEPGAKSFGRVDDIGRIPVRALFQDHAGRLWVGTEGSGVWLMESIATAPRHLDREQGLPGSSTITSFFEDSRHNMWVTTEEAGLFMADASAGEFSFRNFTRRNGLLSRNVCAVTEDEEGKLWVTTIKGLLMMNPDDYTLTTVFEESQIVGNHYSNGAAYRAPGGTIYLGTTDGVFAFNPVSLREQHKDKAVYINSIYAMSGDRITPLASPGASPQTSSSIRVSHKDISTLSISFSSPNYASILETRYECTLTSGKKEVTSVTSYNFIQYANIGYGKHTFTVGVLGNDNPLSRKTLEIIVTPPFWKSTAGMILLAALVIGTGLLCEFFVRRWRKEKRQLQMEKLEQRRRQEVFESRNAFFANITHEIRTPLTLIKMPLDRIIREKEYAPEAEKDMLVIQSNTDRLLSLTNELLDLKKLENGDKKLPFTRQNLCDTVRKTCERFAPTAAEQEVRLETRIPEEVIEVLSAKDAVDTIVGNLLSNALKYGKDLIRVSVERPSEKSVAVRVDSNGRIIPAGERDRIFEKFYQGGKGTGLGLPLSRALAESHGGRLYLDAQRTDMNSFVVELPVSLSEQASGAPAPADPAENRQDLQEFDSSRATLLIVEDNQEFRLYLAREFAEQYNVFLSVNGKMALELMKAQRIDLVVSDIMMPVMDGCELCNEIKTNPEFSHIPVILLTAAVGTDTRIETLKAGADGYIEKPFPIELLRANIVNLFKNKEIANRQFTSSPLAHFSGATSKTDEAFMERLHKIVMENLNGNSLSLEGLAGQLNVSSSTLYRKVKANTGMNVNEYIRLCRLKEAAQLLASRQYRINEVADMLGFSSSSYFAASFQKQFNISPSAFVKSLNK